MAVHYLGDNGPDGMCLGTATTEKVAFFGSTPVVQPSITAVGTTTGSTGANKDKINRLYAALISIGLINTGG